MINFTKETYFLLGVLFLLFLTPPLFSQDQTSKVDKLTDKEISISGKDLFEIKFNILHYSPSSEFGNFINGFDIGTIEQDLSLLYASLGLPTPSVNSNLDMDINSFGVEGVLNKIELLDSGVALGVGLYSGPKISMTLTSGGDYVHMDADFDHTQFYLSPYLSLQKEFEFSSGLKFKPTSTAGARVAYYKLNGEVSYNSSSGMPNISVDEEVMSEFDVYPFIDFGCEIWINKLCVYPSLGYQKDLIQGNNYNFRKGLGLYYVWGIYDSVFFKYATSSTDTYDKDEFQLGASISFF